MKRSVFTRVLVALSFQFLEPGKSSAAATSTRSGIPFHIRPEWNAVPTSTPSNGSPDGPVMGNGAVAVAVSANATGGDLVFRIDRNDAWVPATGDISCCGYSPNAGGGRTLGLVRLRFESEVVEFHATQSIANGTVTTAQRLASGGVLRSSSFVPRGTDVLITEVWWEGAADAGVVSSSLALNISNEQTDAGMNAFCHSYSHGSSSNVMWSSRQLGFPYQNVNQSTVGRRHVYKAAWATIINPPATPVGQHLLHSDGSKLTIVTAVLSNYDSFEYEDPILPSQDLALESMRRVTHLRNTSVLWWQRFWSKSEISLPTAPLLETQWYGSLYILASSHKTDGSPFAVAPGIVWPKTTDAPAFRGAFTMNYNQEALYYGVHAANHEEIAGAYYNAMLQYIPRGRKDARSFFQCPGINMDCEIFHWGQSASGVGDQGQRSNAALAAVPFANHWLWTRDVAWLNSTGWPYLSEVAAFWECYLQQGLNYPGTPEGSYSSVNDCFNELCSGDQAITNVNPHITISLLRFLFPVLIDAAEALHIEPERRKLWKHLHQNLAPLPVLNLGKNISIFGGVLGSPNHPQQGENPLNVYLGWPGWDDALVSDAGLLQVLKNTVSYLESWKCGNCWPQYPPAKIRVQDRAKEAADTWRTMTSILEETIATNLIVADGRGNMDTAMEGAAGIGAVNEMLLQSMTGVIRLFPQVPPDAPASFNNLRARGGFLVSATLDSTAMVSNVVISSQVGQPVVLELPWPTHVRVSVREIASGQMVAATMKDNTLGWPTVAGHSYSVEPTFDAMYV